jgi:hypothetical protein
MTFNIFSFSRVKDTWDFREEPENMRSLGLYLWRTLLVIALLSVLSAAWFGFQELGVVMQAENVAQTPAAPPAPLDPNKLQSQLSAFTTKQAEYQNLSQSPLPQIPDPSE